MKSRYFLDLVLCWKEVIRFTHANQDEDFQLTVFLICLLTQKVANFLRGDEKPEKDIAWNLHRHVSSLFSALIRSVLTCCVPFPGSVKELQL